MRASHRPEPDWAESSGVTTRHGPPFDCTIAHANCATSYASRQSANPMDTQAPTALSGVHHFQEGSYAPPSTPESTVGPQKHRRGDRTGHVAESSGSPLHLTRTWESSRGGTTQSSSPHFASTPTRTSESGHEAPADYVDSDSQARPRSVRSSRFRRFTRRGAGNSKRRKMKEKVESEPEGPKDRRDRRTSKNMTWMERLRRSRYRPRMILENSGSVARDHLASERTFLAYVRTSMGMATMGVGGFILLDVISFPRPMLTVPCSQLLSHSALVQLFAIADITSRATGVPVTAASGERFAKPLGGVSIGLAFAILIIGAFRCVFFQRPLTHFILGLWRYFKIQFSLPGGYFPIARLSAIFTGLVFAALVISIFVAVLESKAN